MIHWFILFDEDGMLETLDFAFYIGSTSTFLSFHLSSCSVLWWLADQKVLNYEFWTNKSVYMAYMVPCLVYIRSSKFFRPYLPDAKWLLETWIQRFQMNVCFGYVVVSARITSNIKTYKIPFLIFRLGALWVNKISEISAAIGWKPSVSLLDNDSHRCQCDNHQDGLIVYNYKVENQGETWISFLL